jgi:predicted component of type VI protein secretion system
LSTDDVPLILLLHKDEKEGLRLLVHPEVRSAILAEDTDCVQSLLDDFVARARLHPEELFKQLSSLEHGPLITLEVGSDLSKFPDIQEQSERFVLL